MYLFCNIITFNVPSCYEILAFIIIILDLQAADLYFACIACAEDGEAIEWLYRFEFIYISAPLIKFAGHLNDVTSTKDLSLINDAYNFPGSRYWFPDLCLFEDRFQLVPWMRPLKWKLCAEELIPMKLNCTTRLCFSIFRKQFEQKQL